jgi:hypothetical protein
MQNGRISGEEHCHAEPQLYDPEVARILATKLGMCQQHGEEVGPPARASSTSMRITCSVTTMSLEICSRENNKIIIIWKA